MKLNLDCMRDILIEMEKAEYGEPIYPQKIYNALPQYSQNEINYSFIKLKEANFIKAVTHSRMDYDTTVSRLDDITYEGHQFLASIRSDTIWNKTKGILNEVGTTSISSVIQTASTIAQAIISKKLGL